MEIDGSYVAGGCIIILILGYLLIQCLKKEENQEKKEENQEKKEGILSKGIKAYASANNLEEIPKFL